MLAAHFLPPANAIKTKIDFSLLTGEWSKPGQCDRDRFVYSLKNKYSWIQKKNGAWKTMYKGIYVHRPKQNSIVIGDGPNMGGAVIDIYKLTQTYYKGEWNVSASEGLTIENPDDAKFSYVKCPKI